MMIGRKCLASYPEARSTSCAVVSKVNRFKGCRMRWTTKCEDKKRYISARVIVRSTRIPCLKRTNRQHELVGCEKVFWGWQMSTVVSLELELSSPVGVIAADSTN